MFTILFSALTAMPVLAFTAADFRTNAKKGDAEAQSKLGVCYANGEGVEKNLPEAAKWYRKAAGQGNQDARKLLNEANISW